MHIQRRVVLLTVLLFALGCASPSGMIPGLGQRKSPRAGPADEIPAFASRARPDQPTPPTGPQWPAAEPARATAVPQRGPVESVLAEAWQAEQNGQLNLARSAYERALAIDPNNAVAHHHLAAMADQEGQFAQAERHYLAALRAAPRDANLLTSLGWSYFLQGRLNESEAALRDALAVEPNHSTALYNLGWLYGSRGDAETALALFRKAGSEGDAQRAMASLFPARGDAPAGAPQQPRTDGSAALEAAPANLAPAPANGAPAYPNEATRKIAEEMERQRAALKARIASRPGNSERNISAPTPWRDTGGGVQNPARATTTDVAPQRRDQFIHPDNINGQFAAIDRGAPFGEDPRATLDRATPPERTGNQSQPALGHNATGTFQQGATPNWGDETAGQRAAPGGWPIPPQSEQPRLAPPPRQTSAPNPFEQAQGQGQWPARVTHADGTAQQLARYPTIHADAQSLPAGPAQSHAVQGASAQAAAAQMGLSAGAGVLIIPPAEATGSAGNSAAAPTSNRADPVRLPGHAPPAATGTAQPATGRQSSPPGRGGLQEADSGLTLAPAAAPPAAVVPSAQSTVYGLSADASGPRDFPQRVAPAGATARPAGDRWPAASNEGR